MRDFRIFFFKVGNGHCSYIEFPNGTNALVDVKVCDETDDLENIVEILRKANINKIDRLIITHPHRDHIGGLSEVVDNFTIDKFLYSPVEFTPDPIYDDWEVYEDMKLGKYCNEAIEVAEGWYSTIGSTRIDYLAPVKTFLENWPEEVNNNSLVLRISARGHKIIIPGDMEEDGWDFISDSGIKNITLLLAPHHGNKGGYNSEKMKKMNPAFVVISAGPKTEHDADKRYRNIARKKVYTTRQKRIVVKIDSNNTLHMIA